MLLYTFPIDSVCYKCKCNSSYILRILLSIDASERSDVERFKKFVNFAEDLVARLLHRVLMQLEINN